jgi:hypothetical protein
MKLRLFVTLVLLGLAAAACATMEQWTTPRPVSQANVGQVITVEGWAVNRKIGAELKGDGFSVFIEGLDSWPAGYYVAGDKGRRVRVTGMLIEAYDLPVFEETHDSPLARQGIPVPRGTDMHQARHRYLLQNAKWELIEP